MTDAATALQEQTAASLERLRDEAVTQVVAGLHDRWPVDPPSLGIAGGPDCRADAQFHLDFLVGSVFTGSAQPFTEYLAWLAAALQARGIELHVLSETLALFRRFFQAHLPPAEWTVLEPILRSGEQALEHLASAVVQMLLARQAAASPATEDNSPRRALFTCVANNHHQIGLRMVADVFELNGWEVQFLGANVPTDEIVAQVAHTRPHLLGLSASLVRHIPTVAEVHRRVRATMEADAPLIIIGGLGVNRLHGIARRLNVDGWYPDALAVLGAVR